MNPSSRPYPRPIPTHILPSPLGLFHNSPPPSQSIHVIPPPLSQLTFPPLVPSASPTQQSPPKQADLPPPTSSVSSTTHQPLPQITPPPLSHSSPPLVTHPMTTHSQDGTPRPHALISTRQPIPSDLIVPSQSLPSETSNFTRAHKNLHWRRPMHNKFNSLLKNHTWS